MTMKGSWGDTFAVPWARGTRSLRFAGLCKRVAGSLLANTAASLLSSPPAVHTHKENLTCRPLLWPQAVDTVQEKAHRTRCTLSASGKAASRCSLRTPPHPCIPCWNPYHSMTAWTPTSDPPVSLLTGACRLRGLPWAASAQFQPQDHRVMACRQPPPWKSLSVSPRPAPWPRNDTQLLLRPLLALMEQMGAESWLEWNRRKT